MTDLSAEMRKALNLPFFSPWVKRAAFAAPIVGLSTEAAAKLLFPGQAETIGKEGFVALGAAVCFATAWLWRKVTGADKRTSQLDQARDWIEAMKLAMDAAEYPKAQQKMIWADIFRKLAQDFKVGGSGKLPAPAEVLQAIDPPTGAARSVRFVYDTRPPKS